MYKIALSPYAKIFYNEWQLDHLSSKYNIVFDQILPITLDVPRLRLSLYRFVSDYLILDIHIIKTRNEPYWTKNSKIKKLELIEDYINEDISQYVSAPFDLENEPLYRFAIFRTPNNTYRFIVVLHHILFGGNSFNFFITEISRYYNDSHYVHKVSKDDQIRYNTLATEKLNQQLIKHSEKSKQFWLDNLCDVEPVDITFIKKRHDQNTKPIIVKEIIFNIANIHSELAELKNVYNLSGYRYSQIVFAILLYRYTSQSKFAISYPILIREFDNFIYGAQINTNVIPYNIDGKMTIAELISQITHFANSLKTKEFNYGHYPIDRTISITNKGYLNVSFIQTILRNKKFTFDDIKVINISHDNNVDLTNKIAFEQELTQLGIQFKVKYNYNEIDEEVLHKFIVHYKKLFIEILSDLVQQHDNKIISSYTILSITEYQQIIYNWNNTCKIYPKEKTIAHLFEEQVLITPNSTAIICNDVQLTYRELNEQANKFAHYLKMRYQIKGDDLIVICVDRNEYFLIIMLATLKAGAAYIPIDPSYPDSRISHIIQDTTIKLIFTNEKYLDRLNKIKPPDVNLESVDGEIIRDIIKMLPVNNLNFMITSHNLAYVIYTSGTTGKPKGVMIEHGGLVNYLMNIKSKIFINPFENVDFSTNIGFDLTVTNTLGALCSGYTVYVYSEQLNQFNKYKAHLINHKISIVKLAPSYFELLIDVINETSITKVILGGEKVSESMLRKIHKSDLIIYDEYGPTETTVGCCLSKVYENGIVSDCISIGTAYNNCTSYVLDSKLFPVPIGAVGELYIGGDGLARGYLNLPKLTQERFIANSFQSKEEKEQGKNTRLYKTGDLVRYLPNGNLEYLGRNDFQVKIRGFRIELGEIEALANSFAGVKQSVVIVTDLNSGEVGKWNKCLVGYYVADYKLDETLLLEHLTAKLPEYMIPITFIHITNMPMTINGKLDRSALPEPDLLLQNKYVAPTNSLEYKICGAFSDVLGLPSNRIGINHDFFKLGGNSILAISLTYKLQYNFQISVNDIFKLRTPANITKSVSMSNGNLRYKLEMIKVIYDKLLSYESDPSDQMINKQLKYLQKVKLAEIDSNLKNISNVLLTGATGHLGCHVLYQLLFETKYNIYVLIRGTSKEHAYSRLSKKFEFYFDMKLDNYLDRIKIFVANIEKPKLNLSSHDYNELISNVDSIIHVAALVKHYGDFSVFHRANVYATENLIELSKLTKLKDFHYISTLSVLTNGYIPQHNYHIFTEDDNAIELENAVNVYSRTKYEGEIATVNSRISNVNSNIYRVGNLSMNSRNYRNQENIEENAFFIIVKTILELGVIPKEISNMEISPVDFSALAIVKLFDKVVTTNQTYHVANPHISNLFTLFKSNKALSIKLVAFHKFIDILLEQLNNDSGKQIELFILHQGWLEKNKEDNLTKFAILQDKTDYILTKLGFKWPQITSEMFSDIVQVSLGVGLSHDKLLPLSD